MADQAGTFRKIVVGTDGFGPASRAVQKAVDLARDSGGEVVVVHVEEEHPGAAGLRDDLVSPADRGRGILSDIQKRHGDGVRLRTESRHGNPAEVLVELAEEEGADLIVVGNKGMSKRFHLGIVPDRVSHHAPCNVLIVHTVDD